MLACEQHQISALIPGPILLVAGAARKENSGDALQPARASRKPRTREDVRGWGGYGETRRHTESRVRTKLSTSIERVAPVLRDIVISLLFWGGVASALVLMFGVEGLSFGWCLGAVGWL